MIINDNINDNINDKISININHLQSTPINELLRGTYNNRVVRWQLNSLSSGLKYI